MPLYRRAFLALMAAAASGCRAEVGATPRTGTTPARSAAFYAACEGCEAALERAPAGLSWRAQVSGPGEPGAPLTLRGRVLRPDGRTPAAGVVVYAHHTNAAGAYAGGSNESEWSRRHGRLRAWVRTGPDGRYEFQTVKPGPYPGRTDPAHIHLTVVEPGDRPYWIDDVVFAGEFGVTPAYRAERENRGGPGIVSLAQTREGGWLALRDIVLAP